MTEEECLLNVGLPACLLPLVGEFFGERYFTVQFCTHAVLIVANREKGTGSEFNLRFAIRPDAHNRYRVSRLIFKYLAWGNRIPAMQTVS